jgi:hypothetical protein
MNDLLWLVNHPLWDNVMGIPTSQNPDTLEGHESQLSIGIHWILAELPHSTELELGKLRWTRMDSGRAFTLELLWGLPKSREVLQPSKPLLSLYSTKIEFGSTLGGAKPHFLHTFYRREHCGIYRSKVVLWLKIGCGRPTCQVCRPCNLARRPSFFLAPPLGIGYLKHRLCWTCRQNSFWKCTNTSPPGQGDVAGRTHLGSVQPVLCATSFPRVIFSMTMPSFGHNEDMHGFWSIWCFSDIQCSRNVRSTKLVELVSNKHLSSISWMKCRYVGGKYMHFMTTNTPPPTHTHTLRVLLIPEQKKRIKSWGQ